MIEILKEENAAEVGGIMHCFSGSPETALECVKMNFYISLGGPVTFKNAKKPKEVAKAVPLDRLLIETDCPYLAPHPYRGKRNEPAYVKLVAEEIAALKGLSFEEVAKAQRKMPSAFSASGINEPCRIIRKHCPILFEIFPNNSLFFSIRSDAIDIIRPLFCNISKFSGTFRTGGWVDRSFLRLYNHCERKRRRFLSYQNI